MCGYEVLKKDRDTFKTSTYKHITDIFLYTCMSGALVSVTCKLQNSNKASFCQFDWVAWFDELKGDLTFIVFYWCFLISYFIMFFVAASHIQIPFLLFAFIRGGMDRFYIFCGIITHSNTFSVSFLGETTHWNECTCILIMKKAMNSNVLPERCNLDKFSAGLGWQNIFQECLNFGSNSPSNIMFAVVRKKTM